MRGDNNARCSREDFARIWKEEGASPTRVAKRLGISCSSVYQRRRELAENGVILRTIAIGGNSTGNNGRGSYDWQTEAPAYTPRLKATIRDGYIVAFSDVHCWPGIRSLATDALMAVLKELKPKIVIANGDILDGASISRHDPLGWQKLPRIVDELDAAKSFLSEVERLTPKARHIFCAGNHDSRFDRRLASEISEFEDVPGMRLEHHLKQWQFCYACMVNEETEPSYFLHAHRGGIHAPRNNAISAGCTVFTGHLHSQKVMPVTTLLSELDGVDCGVMADRDGPQFSYVASKPTDWREGFAVQYYDKHGYRFPAELCRVKYFRTERKAFFRGEVLGSRKL